MKYKTIIKKETITGRSREKNIEREEL